MDEHIIAFVRSAGSINVTGHFSDKCNTRYVHTRSTQATLQRPFCSIPLGNYRPFINFKSRYVYRQAKVHAHPYLVTQCVLAYCSVGISGLVVALGADSCLLDALQPPYQRFLRKISSLAM